ncbi:MAG: sulfurtransferase-like selenium metabolism protein YedF [Thermovirgaceae bacterium]|jgi:selenium metabolism protein YedF|nr:sulfurtransferase-like selenium metabolism protein YedF [Synergistales bacterium]MDI9392136.1 sulfurtransferase-like selenium metabolism protein YedF [Synergistota bacterium]MDY0179392.1 sulfurtransferase-like selenium metabolism protein YedF [Synergistaceae bacterium]HRW88030.1 sulfurtransferase-like selenium metabolism protein YedF [Thermovirgaceae bacterium]MDD3134011.1 sulfurtransferase-like selenium metabolism protein YedF [Synergistales bacterium]
MHKVDARNRPCPKPVIMTREALKSHGLPLEIVVDSGIPLLNVRRFLESQNIRVSFSEAGGYATLVCTEGDQAEGALQAGTAEKRDERPEDVAILVCSEFLGHSDRLLGDVLIKSFLGTLVEREQPPALIALMNEGVKLALPGSSASESLQALQARGTEILVCGTCSSHFGITDSISVGIISNMFDITGSLLRHQKSIVLG